MALRWKKYSFPSSPEMNPKPRSATIFLMVPSAIYLPPVPRNSSTTASFEEPTERRPRRLPLTTPAALTAYVSQDCSTHGIDGDLAALSGGLDRMGTRFAADLPVERIGTVCY